MKLSPLFAFLLLVLVPVAARAQSQRTVSQDGLVELSNAPSGTTTYDNVKKLGRITKDVVITQKKEDLIVYAQDVLYSQSQNQATATGQVRVLTRNSTVRGQKIFADFNARRFIVTGNVVITSYGENDGAMSGLRSATPQKAVRVSCERAVWDYDTRQATATGSVVISQQTTRGTCNSILYDEPSNVIRLEGNVRFENDKGQRLRSQRVIFYVDKDFAYSKGVTRVALLPRNQNGNPRPDKQRQIIEPAPELPVDLERTLVEPIPTEQAASGESETDQPQNGDE